MNERPPVSAGFWAAVGVFWFVCSCGLLKMVVLKETPVFWTNAGGYPIALRDFVRVGFYPLLLLTGAGMALSTVLVVRLVLRSTVRPAIASLLALLPAWALYVLVVGVLVANNLMNLLAGRALHHH